MNAFVPDGKTESTSTEVAAEAEVGPMKRITKEKEADLRIDKGKKGAEARRENRLVNQKSKQNFHGIQFV